MQLFQRIGVFIFVPLLIGGSMAQNVDYSGTSVVNVLKIGVAV